MPAVTISAGYGLGGGAVARAVADRLGFAMLDRAISSQVAQELDVSVEEATEGEVKRGFVERFFGQLAPLVGGGILDGGDDLGTSYPAMEAAQFRQQAEAIVRAALPDGVVVLGRAGSAMLCTEPSVLRVRLYGPRQARIGHAVAAEGIDADTAADRLPTVDRARAHYVRRLYDRDIDDPDLYHLQLDSTALAVDVVADTIVRVFEAVR